MFYLRILQLLQGFLGLVYVYCTLAWFSESMRCGHLTSHYLVGRVPLNVMMCPEKLFCLSFSPDLPQSLHGWVISHKWLGGACEEFDNNRRFLNQSLSENQTCNSRDVFGGVWRHLPTCCPSLPPYLWFGAWNLRTLYCANTSVQVQHWCRVWVVMVLHTHKVLHRNTVIELWETLIWIFLLSFLSICIFYPHAYLTLKYILIHTLVYFGVGLRKIVCENGCLSFWFEFLF